MAEKKNKKKKKKKKNKENQNPKKSLDDGAQGEKTWKGVGGDKGKILFIIKIHGRSLAEPWVRQTT